MCGRVFTFHLFSRKYNLQLKQLSILWRYAIISINTDYTFEQLFFIKKVLGVIWNRFLQSQPQRERAESQS